MLLGSLESCLRGHIHRNVSAAAAAAAAVIVAAVICARGNCSYHFSPDRTGDDTADGLGDAVAVVGFPLSAAGASGGELDSTNYPREARCEVAPVAYVIGRCRHVLELQHCCRIAVESPSVQRFLVPDQTVYDVGERTYSAVGDGMTSMPDVVDCLVHLPDC